VRAASPIPKGAQVTASYLDTRGGVPLANRRRALNAAYGFKCACVRCRLEESMPQELQEQIARLHALAAADGPFDELPAAVRASDAAALRAMLAAAAPEAARFEELCEAAKVPAGSLDRAALSAGAAGFFLAVQRVKMAAVAVEAKSACGGGGSEAVEVAPSDLLDLVEVFRVFQPGGPGVLATAADALSWTASKHGAGSPQAKAALQLFLKVPRPAGGARNPAKTLLLLRRLRQRRPLTAAPSLPSPAPDAARQIRHRRGPSHPGAPRRCHHAVLAAPRRIRAGGRLRSQGLGPSCWPLAYS
jgi:hypothetical protein